MWPVGAVSKTTWSKPGRVARKQPDELIEGGDLGGAGAGELLPHRCLLLGRGRGSHLLEDTGPVGLGRGLGIDVQGDKARHARHRPWRVGQR